MLSLYLLFCRLLVPAPAGLSATVVDATTSRPLAGAVVRTQTSAQTSTTDERGHFSLDPRPDDQSLTISRLGYAPLVLTRAQFQQADTLRLLPRAYVLGEVAVGAQTPKTRLISSVPAKRPVVGKLLLPGQSEATVLFRPAELGPNQTCVLNQASFYLLGKPRPGQLRVRLVALSAQAGPQASAELLPVPVYVSAAQVSGHRVRLDLSAYNIILPAEGLCLVVECLPTATDPTAISPNASPQGAGYPSIEARGYTLAEAPTRLTWFRKTADAAWYQPTPLLHCMRWDVELAVY